LQVRCCVTPSEHPRSQLLDQYSDTLLDSLRLYVPVADLKHVSTQIAPMRDHDLWVLPRERVVGAIVLEPERDIVMGH